MDWVPAPGQSRRLGALEVPLFSSKEFELDRQRATSWGGWQMRSEPQLVNVAEKYTRLGAALSRMHRLHPDVDHLITLYERLGATICGVVAPWNWRRAIETAERVNKIMKLLACAVCHALNKTDSSNWLCMMCGHVNDREPLPNPSNPIEYAKHGINLIVGASFNESDLSPYVQVSDISECFVCKKPLKWPGDEHRMNSVTEDGQVQIACTNCRPIYSRCEHTDAPEFDDATLQKVIFTVGTDIPGKLKTVNYLCCPDCKNRFDDLLKS